MENETGRQRNYCVAGGEKSEMRGAGYWDMFGNIQKMNTSSTYCFYRNQSLHPPTSFVRLGHPSYLTYLAPTWHNM